jgi:hypothetical protein
MGLTQTTEQFYGVVITAYGVITTPFIIITCFNPKNSPDLPQMGFGCYVEPNLVEQYRCLF